MKLSLNKVLIAGIGGASLGTEILKCLRLVDKYEIYGCDISPTAYGLFESGFKKTFHIDMKDYVQNVLKVCLETGCKWVIPGGEQPTKLLVEASNYFKKEGISFLTNSTDVVKLCSDKNQTFKILKEQGIHIPRTIAVQEISDINYVGLPCIIKPATDSGGSVNVFFATTTEEAWIYADYIKRNGNNPIAQEYIDIAAGGEFTIGVLSLPNQNIIGSIALKRDLNAKLSVSYSGRGGIISSGYSQGFINEYSNLCSQAEHVASIIGSRGPLNIQARVRDGILLPFEINPRFSASTYLRTLAGFNEVDMFLQYFISGEIGERPKIRSGWYLRSLTEQFIEKVQ